MTIFFVYWLNDYISITDVFVKYGQGSTSDAGPSGAGTPDAGACPSASVGPSSAGPSALSVNEGAGSSAPSGAGPSAPSGPSCQPARTPQRRRIP
jgi:hypothetical protein